MCFITLSFSSIAQTFSEIGTVWKNERFYVTGPGGPGQGDLSSTRIERYEYYQDTIVGLDTFQLFSFCKKYRWNTSGGSSGMDYSSDTLLVYQDSSRVYVGEIGNFEIKYDFNLVLGDSFLVNRWENGPDTVYSHVKQVDSVSINGLLRKRISFDTITDYNQGMVWIEGVGDFTFGLFPYNVIEHGVSLDNCFIQDDSTIYGNCPSDYSCPKPYVPPVDYSQEDEEMDGAYIFPNPFNNQISIFYEEADPEYTLLLFDVQGQKIYQEIVTGSSHTMNLEVLEVGAYIIRLSDARRVFTFKIIKYE